MKQYHVIQCPTCHQFYLSSGKRQAQCPYCGTRKTIKKLHDLGSLINTYPDYYQAREKLLQLTTKKYLTDLNKHSKQS